MRKSDKSTLKILEIQGLRALAVTLVIFYHADFLPGGFIGVDIFYVISGYLITNLIIKEISTTGSLNLRNFYTQDQKITSCLSFSFTNYCSSMLLITTTSRSLSIRQRHNCGNTIASKLCFCCMGK